MLATRPLLIETDFPRLRRDALRTLQANLGYRCNQQCQHCHVNAGPKRTEVMARETIDLLIDVLDRRGIKELDLTGGAPELNPHFRHLVTAARALDITVIDRCNLTVLEEPGQRGLARFLAAQRVRVVASMPCYLQENVDRQRGKGVFESSLRGLRTLNALGYGEAGSGLELDLVYNPQGAELPPPQEVLEADYKRELGTRHGIVFNRLLTLANMPIERFGSTLLSRGEFDNYLTLLRGAHCADNLSAVMCRSLVSVDWKGRLYDCDFNQMLQIPLGGGAPCTLDDLLEEDLEGRGIAVGEHCYGCTAGQGSSCGGAL